MFHVHIQRDMLSDLHAYWKGKDNFLGNNLKMTFPFFRQHILLQTLSKFSKPGAQAVVIAQWVGRKVTRKCKS